MCIERFFLPALYLYRHARQLYFCLVNSSNFVSKKRLAVSQRECIFCIRNALNIEIRVILLFNVVEKKHKKSGVKNNNGRKGKWQFSLLLYYIYIYRGTFVKLWDAMPSFARLRIMRWTYSCFYTRVAMKIEQKAGLTL